MFFRKKKEKDRIDDDSKRCESTTCPTPEIFHPKGMFFELDGRILCQFCYTKELSEKPAEEDFERPTTKLTTEISMQRIAPRQVQWDLSTTATTNLQRIGPSQTNEKYTEEVTKWTDILKAINVPQEISTVVGITKLNNTPRARIIETTGGFLLVSFVSKQENEIKNEEELIQEQIFSTEQSKPSVHKVTTFPDSLQNWILSSISIEPLKASQELFLRYTIVDKGKTFSLENLANEPYYEDLYALLFELGRYFYFVNFLGFADATQFALISLAESVRFVNLSNDLTKSSFSNLKLALQQLYSQIPFILDEKYLESFIEGAAKQQQILQNVLESDSNGKDLILNFFEQNNIEFIETKPLPSIKVFL